MFIREKKISCGKYTEIDIIPRTETAEQASRGKRGKRRKAKKPKQTDLNDKNAKRYLVQLGNGNFGRNDIHLTLTYDAKHLPDTVEEAERTVTNYLRRVAYRRKKLELEPLKYILVTEYKFAKNGEQIKRIHHHIIMNGGQDREEVERMWTCDRINWKKYQENREYRSSIKAIGYANADRLQLNENGIEALCKYIVKDPQGKKRFSSSRNLERPDTERRDGPDNNPRVEVLRRWKGRRLNDVFEKCNDYKYSKKKVEQLAKSNDCGLEEFRKIYKGYNITEVTPVYCKDTGWHIYLKMWEKDEPKKKTTRKEKR